MNDERKLEILGLVIDLLRQEGVEMKSAYDLENFFEVPHSFIYRTGRFPTDTD